MYKMAQNYYCRKIKNSHFPLLALKKKKPFQILQQSVVNCTSNPETDQVIKKGFKV